MCDRTVSVESWIGEAWDLRPTTVFFFSFDDYKYKGWSIMCWWIYFKSTWILNMSNITQASNTLDTKVIEWI